MVDAEPLAKFTNEDGISIIPTVVSKSKEGDTSDGVETIKYTREVINNLGGKIINRGKVWLSRKDAQDLELLINCIMEDKPELIPKMESVFSVMTFSGKNISYIHNNNI